MGRRDEEEEVDANKKQRRLSEKMMDVGQEGENKRAIEEERWRE